MFSDGSDVRIGKIYIHQLIFISDFQIFHSDYFSGWDESELQRVLDNCENDSEAAMPTAYCSDWLTFRGKGKTEGVQVDDEQIRKDLEDIQPALIDTKATISAEEVTNISQLPRGTCTGTLIPWDGSTNAPTAAPTTTAPSGVTGMKRYSNCHMQLRTYLLGTTTCGKNTKLKIKIKSGETYSFKTNDDGQYQPNMKCNVVYQRASGCKKMRVDCDQFSLGKGDILRWKSGKTKKM